MKVAIYPGSFNPWHDGHTDILKKTLQVFDEVIIAIGHNPEKGGFDGTVGVRVRDILKKTLSKKEFKRIKVTSFVGLLTNEVVSYNHDNKHHICAVVRGLRNSNDLLFEQTQQYWNEDLGITVPTVYIISDRTLVHISSSAIKLVKKAKS